MVKIKDMNVGDVFEFYKKRYVKLNDKDIWHLSTNEVHSLDTTDFDFEVIGRMQLVGPNQIVVDKDEYIDRSVVFDSNLN